MWKLNIISLLALFLVSTTPLTAATAPAPRVKTVRIYKQLSIFIPLFIVKKIPSIVAGTLLSGWSFFNLKKKNQLNKQIQKLRFIISNEKEDLAGRLKLLAELENLKHKRKFYAFMQFYAASLGVFCFSNIILEEFLNKYLYEALLGIVASLASITGGTALVYNFLHDNHDPEGLPEEKVSSAEMFLAEKLQADGSTIWSVLEAEKLKDFNLNDVEMPGAVARNLADITIFLKNPEKAAELKTKPTRGIMLSGPPGCGKSLLAKSFAHSLGFKFIAATGSEFVNKYVGTGAASIKNLFRLARENAPCVLFIDEIDSIARARKFNDSDGCLEYQRALNQLLAELDGTATQNAWDGVFVIGATNLVRTIDPALLRAGRLGKILEMSMPDLAARKNLLTKTLKDSKFNLTTEDLNNLAIESVGMSGAKIYELVQMSLLEVAKNNLDKQKKTWPTEILFQAMERLQFGEQDDSMLNMSLRDKTRIAYHEAGHALVALLTPKAKPLHKITIIPRVGGALGLTLCLPEHDYTLMNKERLNAEIMVFLGSLVAEKIAFGDHANGVVDDLEKASLLAKTMVAKYAMSDYGTLVETDYNETRWDSHLAKADLEKYAKQIIAENLAAVEALFKDQDNLNMLHLLAKELMARKTLSVQEVRTLLKLPAERGRPEPAPTQA